MRDRTKRHTFLSCIFLLSPAGGGLFAQTNAEINAGLQFNFSNPGARSLGFAGAFTALADDATAAYTNPAGLTNLSKPEIALEGRYWRYKNVYQDRGHAIGNPSGTGADTVSGLVNAETTDNTKGLSFVSLVYPSNRWAVAVYRHELANFKASSQSFGPFVGGPPDFPFPIRFFPVRASLDLKIVNYGASLALKFGERFSLGVGVSRSEYKENSVVTRYHLIGGGTTPGEFYGPPNYADSNVLVHLRSKGKDSKVVFNAGFLWKIARQLSVGAVYRQGPKFNLDVTSELGPAAAGFPQIITFPGRFRVPDVYGAGIAFRPVELFTVSFDYDRVRYSQFTDNFADIGNRSEISKDFKIDDGNEYRLGLQYAFPIGTSTLALRAGAWRDPDHRVRYTGQVLPGDSLETRVDKTSFILLFRPGVTETHYAGGLGLSVGEHFQIDVAYDSSPVVKTGSASMVVRF